MNTGIKGEKKFTVTKEQLACNVGSGLVSVFATPMMIAAIDTYRAFRTQKIVFSLERSNYYSALLLFLLLFFEKQK